MHSQQSYVREALRHYPLGHPMGGAFIVRIIIGLLLALSAFFSYCGSQVYNPITGEKQYIGITEQQEIALGLQAAPHMVKQHGGLSSDRRAQALLEAVGKKVVSESSASQAAYPFAFHLLADQQTVNAFALPGGQIFLTAGLLQQLKTEGQLAAVLAHEIGHVIARHSAERIAKQQLAQGLTGALVLATYDPNDPSTQRTAQVAMVIGELVNMRYGRKDELESDRLGVRFMAEASYDPRALVQVMHILEDAAGKARLPEFFSTHPNPENRIAQIQEAIQEQFPTGVPQGLTP